jgi:hypothetical protein
MVTKEGYIKTQPHVVLDTRALPHRDDIITQWLIQWQGLSTDQATWEDKLFIKATFPDFYQRTLKEWWPQATSCGQEQSQVGGLSDLEEF